MSDQTGAIVWSTNYKAWGECKTENHTKRDIWDSEIITNNLRFQGQYFDQETGLHYNRYRYYSPYVGRFISKDPIGLLGGLNTFAYAPNPVGWVDPLGLNPNCRITGNKYSKASDMSITRQGTKQWESAVKSIANSGSGDIRVATMADAKKLMADANLRLNRMKMYQEKSMIFDSEKGEDIFKYNDYTRKHYYQVHQPQNGPNRTGKPLSALVRWKSGESDHGNDLAHIVWYINDKTYREGHIFYGNAIKCP